MLTLLLIAPNTFFQETYFRWQLIDIDKDDNKFVDVAIASGADYLVTNDTDFNTLKTIQFPNVSVITLHDFLALFA